MLYEVITRHRLLDRPPGHQQEPDALFTGLHGHLVPAVEQDERPVPGGFADMDLCISYNFV